MKRQQCMKRGSMYKILIVDDDHAIRLLYKTELEDEGYSVTTIGSCYNLLDQIDYFRPDLILLEVKLDNINGLDVLQGIREQYYDMPIILCSAYASFRYDLRAIAADYYVAKQIDLSELKFKIKIAFESINEMPESVKPDFSERYLFGLNESDA